MENVGVLYHFMKFKLLAPDAIKKCQSIRDEEKNGQSICLDNYNSREFSSIINILKTINLMKMEENENLNDNLSIFFEKNKLIKENHDKILAVFNSKCNLN